MREASGLKKVRAGEQGSWLRREGRYEEQVRAQKEPPSTSELALSRDSGEGGSLFCSVDVGLAVEQQPRDIDVAALGGADQGGPPVLPQQGSGGIRHSCVCAV